MLNWASLFILNYLLPLSHSRLLKLEHTENLLEFLLSGFYSSKTVPFWSTENALDFAVNNLTPTGRLSKHLKTSITVDHITKQVSLYHPNLRNAVGMVVSVATKVLKSRSEQHPNQHWIPKSRNVRAPLFCFTPTKFPFTKGQTKENSSWNTITSRCWIFARGLRSTIIPFMKCTNSTGAFLDCVPDKSFVWNFRIKWNLAHSLFWSFSRNQKWVSISSNFPWFVPPWRKLVRNFAHECSVKHSHFESRKTVSTCQRLDRSKKLWLANRYKSRAERAVMNWRLLLSQKVDQPASELKFFNALLNFDFRDLAKSEKRRADFRKI